MAVNVSNHDRDATLIATATGALRQRLCKRGIAFCISGIDGSGKTTLAVQLERMLRASDIPVRRMHIYQWYANVLLAPSLLLYNYYFGRKVLIFDRSVYDNIAAVATKQYCPRWLYYGVLSVVSSCYPSFDHCFYLVAGFQETLRRRQDTCKAQFIVFRRIYNQIFAHIKHVRLHSDSMLFAETLRNIASSN
jgi:hypothetical protein